MEKSEIIITIIGFLLLWSFCYNLYQNWKLGKYEKTFANTAKFNKQVDEKVKELDFENQVLKNANERFHNALVDLTGVNENLEQKLFKFHRIRDPKSGQFIKTK